MMLPPSRRPATLLRLFLDVLAGPLQALIGRPQVPLGVLFQALPRPAARFRPRTSNDTYTARRTHLSACMLMALSLCSLLAATRSVPSALPAAGSRWYRLQPRDTDVSIILLFRFENDPLRSERQMCWEGAAVTPRFHAGFRRRTRPGKAVRAREALERQALTAQAKGDLSRQGFVCR
jgi:hypothetical protein